MQSADSDYDVRFKASIEAQTEPLPSLETRGHQRGSMTLTMGGHFRKAWKGNLVEFLTFGSS